MHYESLYELIALTRVGQTPSFVYQSLRKSIELAYRNGRLNLDQYNHLIEFLSMK